MVLVSFALVVVATITLVIGLLQSGLTLIYVSIGCSVLAGLVLAIAVLRGRPEEAPAPAAARPAPATVGAGAGTSSPAPPAAEGARPWERTSTADVTPPSGWQAPPPPPPEAEPEPTPAPEPAYAGLSSRPWAGDGDDRTDQIEVASALEEERVGDFPIENYDRLRASEILRLLPDLTPDQLEQVRDREVAGMNRFTVLSRIDAQLETASSADWAVREQEWAAEPVEEPERRDVEERVDQDFVPVGADFAPSEEPEAPAAPVRTRRRPADKAPSAGKAPARKRTRPAATVESAPEPPAPARRGRTAKAPAVDLAESPRKARGRKTAAEPMEPVPTARSRRPPSRAAEPEPVVKAAGTRRAAKKAPAATAPPAPAKRTKKAAAPLAAAPEPAKRSTAKRAGKKAAAVATKTAVPAKKAARRTAKGPRSSG